MFERLSAFVVDPSDIARGLNSDYGISDNDWNNPNAVEAYEVLNTLSSEQSYGDNCYVSVYIGNSEIEDAINQYKRAVDEDWASEDVHYYSIRMRALKWLRNHIPLTDDRILLEVDY